MGCDIHMVLERRETGTLEWVGVWASDEMPGDHPMIARRDYAFFAEVANVRGEGTAQSIHPRNIPKDVSRLAWLQYMRCPTDYHSASHMTIDEFTAAWFRANATPQYTGPEKLPRKENAAYDLLGVSDYDAQYDWRVVFWFDN